MFALRPQAAQGTRCEGASMNSCYCHGTPPHEWNSEDCDCLEDPVEEGADELTIEDANREESWYLYRQNARDINRR